MSQRTRPLHNRAASQKKFEMDVVVTQKTQSGTITNKDRNEAVCYSFVQKRQQEACWRSDLCIAE
jgi:hypothetical protein